MIGQRKSKRVHAKEERIHLSSHTKRNIAKVSNYEIKSIFFKDSPLNVRSGEISSLDYQKNTFSSAMYQQQNGTGLYGGTLSKGHKNKKRRNIGVSSDQFSRKLSGSMLNNLMPTAELQRK